MRKLIAVAVMLTGFLSASAQMKIAYINIDELIAAMPETEKANKELQDYQESLVKQGQDLQKETNDKIEQFGKDSINMTEGMKEVKRGELLALIQRVQGYNNEAQFKTKQTAQDKFGPIQQKALETIKIVAKKNGYSYVLDINSVFVGPPGDDILSLVKKELGIQEKPAPVPAKTGN